MSVFLALIGWCVLGLTSCSAETIEAVEPSPPVERAAVPTPTPTSGTIRITAVGDIMIGSPYLDDTRMPPNDGADIFSAVKPIIEEADIAFGNLEGPLIDDGESEKCKPPKPGQPIRCYSFRMPTRYATHLKEAGFDVLSLANNHALDFGFAGSRSTRDALDSVGILHAGSDRGEFSTAIFEVNGRRVAFVAFAHNAVVPNVNDLTTAARLVREAGRKADVVVVSFHGGAEGPANQLVPNRTELYFGEKRGNLPLFARTVIDAGADLVLGHGPHVLRGMEIYKNRLIAYSLGNFATYGWFRLQNETALTMILDVELEADGRFASGKIHPGVQEGRGIPVIDPNNSAIKKVASLSRSNFPSTSPRITGDGQIMQPSQ